MDEGDVAVEEVQSIFIGLIRGIVDEPEAVYLTPRTTGNKIVFQLRVADGDVSKIIGQNLSALRHLLTVASRKCGQTLVLKMEPGNRSTPKTRSTSLRLRKDLLNTI